MATAQRSTPVTGTARWVGEASNGNPLLSITPAGGEQKVYEVEEVRYGAAYNLHTVGEYTCYRVTRDECGALNCNCPDVVEGGRPAYLCKHVRALRAALRAAF